MIKVKQNIYTSAVLTKNYPIIFEVSTNPRMGDHGWHLVDEREISIEVPDIDYAEVIKQKKIDAILSSQEKLNAELIELTS